MKARKHFSGATAIVVAASTAMVGVPSVANADVFSDVHASHYFYEDVLDLHNRGILNGFSDGTFKPDEALTRGQAAKIIAGVLGLDTKNVINPNFTDIQTTHPYYGAIAALNEAGIIDGFDDNSFRPGENIQRHHIAKILARSFQLTPHNADALPFTDVRSEYKEAVSALYELGVTTGKTATTFDGTAKVTRGQMAAFIVRSEKAIQQQQAAIQNGTHTVTLTDFTNSEMTTDKGKLTFDEAFSAIFSTANKAALQHATMTVEVKDGKISAINHLVLNASGSAEAPIVFKAATTVETFTLNASYVNISDLNIIDDLFISSGVSVSANFSNMTIAGKLVIDDPRVSKQAALTNSAQLTANDLLLGFFGSTVPAIDLKRDHVTINTDRTIQGITVFPSIAFFQLNGSISNVQIQGTGSLELSGNANIALLELLAATQLQLNTTGTISELAVNHSDARIVVHPTARITNLLLLAGMNVRTIITNFDQIADHISKIKNGGSNNSSDGNSNSGNDNGGSNNSGSDNGSGGNDNSDSDNGSGGNDNDGSDNSSGGTGGNTTPDSGTLSIEVNIGALPLPTNATVSATFQNAPTVVATIVGTADSSTLTIRFDKKVVLVAGDTLTIYEQNGQPAIMLTYNGTAWTAAEHQIPFVSESKTILWSELNLDITSSPSVSAPGNIVGATVNSAATGVEITSLNPGNIVVMVMPINPVYNTPAIIPVSVARDGKITIGQITPSTILNVPTTGILLNRPIIDDLEIGTGANTNKRSYQLEATILPTNATNKGIIWSSTTPAVATVSQDGLVTAVGEGQAIITATTSDGGFTANSSVTVTKKTAVEQVTINGEPKVGKTLNAVTNPGASNLQYQWQEASTATGPFTDIVGATNDSLTLTAVQQEKYIRVNVTGENATILSSAPMLIAARGNLAPIQIKSFDTQLIEYQGQKTIDLSEYFSDPDGDPLTYTVENAFGLTATLIGPTLTMQGDYVGTGILSLMVTDNHGGVFTSNPIIATITDTTPPVFMNSPTISNVKERQVDVTATVNENSTIYYVVLPKNATAPTAAQVVNGKDSSGTDYALKGSYSAVKNTATPFTISGLQPSTELEIYTVAKDGANNHQPAVTKLSVTTIATPKLMSKAITNFNFETVYATQARAASKPMTTSYFKDNPKEFTISDGQVVIPVKLDWDIIPEPATGFTISQLVGSAIESTIQDYCNANGIPLGERTLAAMGFVEDSFFSVMTFKPGANTVIEFGGKDWNYFFEQQRYSGSNPNTDKNRSFSISDGVKTASIHLQYDYSNMSALVVAINRQLRNADLNIEAVQINDNHFELVASSSQYTIEVNGTNKAEFFE